MELKLTGSTATTGEDIMFTNIDTTSSTTFIWTDHNFNTNEITIDSFNYKETDDGNFIEVVKRQEPMQSMISPGYEFNYEPPKDRVWKEVYGISTGEDGNRSLQLLRTIEGKVTPAYTVEESVEFE